MIDKLRRDIISMFWETGIDYAVMTCPDISETEEELLKQQELWLKLNNAYQQGVKDVVEFIFDNYKLVELPVKEKLENLEKIEKDNPDISILKANAEEIYKYINDSLLSLHENNNKTRLWVSVKLKEKFGPQVAVQCDKNNNTKDIIDQNLLIARVTWNSDYSKIWQTKHIEFIFGEKEAVDKYQNQCLMDNETIKFIQKGL